MKVELFPTLQDIYPDSPNDHETFRSLLQGLDRDQVLIWCSHLNLHVSHPLGVDNQQLQTSFMQAFFTADALTNAIRFMNEHGVDRVHYVHRGQLLELMRWASLFCTDHVTNKSDITDDATRAAFVKALLMAGSLWSDRITDYGRRFEQADNLENTRLRALGSIRQGISDSSLRLTPMDTIGRGNQIFGIMSRFYHSFDDDFASKTGLQIDQYYRCLLLLIVHYWGKSYVEEKITVNDLHLFDPDGFLANIPHMKPLFRRFMDLKSQTSADLKKTLWPNVQNSDPISAPLVYYTGIRQKPILRSGDRCIIMDPVFFLEQAAIGPLFHILTSSNVGKVFDAFGKSFQEYASNILRRIYPASSLYNPLSAPLERFVKRGKKVEIIDAGLNNVIEFILIEMKAILIRDEYVLDPNHTIYISQLREKYGTGVKQLARAIRKLTSREWIPLQPNSAVPQDISTVQRIFPVLLVQDTMFTMALYQDFFLREFQKALQPEMEVDRSDMMVNGVRIAPLTVMTINDLELLESSSRNFSLQRLLSDYVRELYSGSMLSLAEYLSQTPHYRTKLVESELVRESLDRVFADAMRFLFPDADQSLDNIK